MSRSSSATRTCTGASMPRERLLAPRPRSVLPGVRSPEPGALLASPQPGAPRRQFDQTSHAVERVDPPTDIDERGGNARGKVDRRLIAELGLELRVRQRPLQV